MRILCAVDSRGSPAKSDPFSCIAVTERSEETTRLVSFLSTVTPFVTEVSDTS